MALIVGDVLTVHLVHATLYDDKPTLQIIITIIFVLQITTVELTVIK